MTELIRRMTEPLRRRIALLVGRAIVTLIDDTTGLQQAQVSLLAGEIRDKIDRMQQYGFTSVPLPGAQGAAVFIGGDREHGVLICTDDARYRLKNMASGEVAIYTDQGDKIHFKRGGTIEIVASSKVTINGTSLEVLP